MHNRSNTRHRTRTLYLSNIELVHRAIAHDNGLCVAPVEQTKAREEQISSKFDELQRTKLIEMYKIFGKL